MQGCLTRRIIQTFFVSHVGAAISRLYMDTTMCLGIPLFVAQVQVKGGKAAAAAGGFYSGGIYRTIQKKERYG